MPRKLVTNITDIFSASWSRDGKWIYFMSGEDKRRGIYRCPANGGDAVLITALPPEDSGYHSVESFDGETVYFARTETNTPLDMASIKRPGTKSPVEEVPRLLLYDSWTVTPGGIYFVPWDAPKSIRYFDFKTRKIRPILEVEKDFEPGLSISGDGRWLIYTQATELNTNIMLVDNLR
jgi:hypothetical protein